MNEEPMHFVQREHERALLRQLYEDCSKGRGRIVHVTGPTASGKSALLHDFVGHVAASGGLHLPASGVNSEQSLSLGLINQIMGAAGLSAIEPVAEPEPGETGELPSRLIPRLEELCGELKGIAARAPLVLHVDDAHLADATSVCCLLYVLRRLRGTPLMSVITERPPPHGTVGKHLKALAWLPLSTRVRLAPLNESDVRDLWSEHVPDIAPAVNVADLMRATGGVPALVLAALEDHRPAPCTDPTLGTTVGTTPGTALGPAYREAFAEYLHRHGPDTVELATALAVLSEAGTRDSPTLLLPHPSEARTSMDRLLSAGIVDADGFRHPAAQAAVLESMDSEEHARTHLRCARLLRENDAPAGRIARHLRHAGHVSDPWAIPLLCEAGEQALAQGETTTAIDYLSTAAASCTDPEAKPRIALALAATLWRVDPEAASRHLLRLTDDAIAGRLPACELYALLRGLLWIGHRTEVERVLLRLPEAVRADPDPAAAIEVRITRSLCATSHPEVTDLLPVARHHDEIADTPRIATPVLRLNGAEALAEALAPDDHREAAAKAEEVLTNAGLGEHMVEAVFSALSALIYTDRLERAAYWSESLIDSPGRRSPLWLAQAHVLRAETALRTGDLGVAHQHATVALSSMSRASWGTAIGLPLSQLLQIAEATGDREAANRIVAEPFSEELFRSRYGLHFLYARGHHHLNARRAEAALSDFSVCGGLMRTWGLDNPALVPWRGGAARAHLWLGDRGTAQALAREQEALVDPGLPRTRGIVLLDLAATLTHQERVPVLAEAARALGPHVEPSPPTIKGVRPHSPGLSKAECRVADLAVQGLTNRQISARLHITISTVEQHLTRIYRKFDISDRRRIADILAPDRDMVH